MDNNELLALFLQDTKNEAIATAIVNQNMGLIGQQLKQYHLTQDDEAKSYCLESFYKAMLTYDPSKSVFSTHATVCVRNALNQLLRVRKINKRCVSFNCFVPNTEGVTYEDLLEDNRYTADTVHDMDNFRQLYSTIASVLDTYKEGLKKDVLTQWVKTGCTISGTELAKRCNTSNAYVSTTLSEFKHKLKVKIGRMHK